MEWSEVTNSADETERLGMRLGQSVRAGDLVLLSGDLGAGKSIVARGIARTLGVTGWRGSPTFNIVHEYPTNPRLLHADFYRLSEAEVAELGLEEYFEDATVMLVEWPERAQTYLQTISKCRVLDVTLVIVDPDTRCIELRQIEGSKHISMRCQ